MNYDAGPVALLLAAGSGRRFGGGKLLAPIADEPMVRRCARQAVASGVPVVVVLGAQAEAVAAALADLPLHLVRNDQWSHGIGSSIAAGVAALQRIRPRASGALLCLADQPLVQSSHLRAMLDRHRADPTRLLVTPYAGTDGPPVLFPDDLFAALADWRGDQGAHALIERERARVVLVAPIENVDVDTPDDLLRIRQHLSGEDKTSKA